MEGQVSQRRGARVMRFRVVALALSAVLLAGVPGRSVHAGAIVGATEFTQLANYAELIRQNMQMVNEVRNTLQAARSLKQSLKQMDPYTISRLTGVPMRDLIAAENLYRNLGGVMDKEQDVVQILQDISSGAKKANLTPREYLQYRANAALRLGGMYAKSYNADRQAMNQLRDQIESLQSAAASAPQVVSQVGGLQTLIGQTTQVQASLLSMNQAVTKANALASLQGQREETRELGARKAETAAQDRLQAIQRQDVQLSDPTELPVGGDGN